MEMFLVVESGVYAGRSLRVSGPLYVIGRDPQCNLRPASESVSRRHCEIQLGSGWVTVRDLGSMNGTIVNGYRLKNDARAIRDGDRLEVGPLVFTVRIEDPAKAGAVGDIPPPPANLGATGDRIPAPGARTAPLRAIPSGPVDTHLLRNKPRPAPAPPAEAPPAEAPPPEPRPAVAHGPTRVPDESDEGSKIIGTESTVTDPPHVPDQTTVVAPALPPVLPAAQGPSWARQEEQAESESADETEATARALTETEHAAPVRPPVTSRLKPAGDYQGVSKAADDILKKMIPKKKKKKP